MEVAAEHAEGERDSARQEMIEGLFLDWIGLQPGYVAPRHPQLSLAVEAHPADAAPSRAHQAAVPAGQASDGALVLRYNQLGVRRQRI